MGATVLVGKANVMLLVVVILYQWGLGLEMTMVDRLFACWGSNKSSDLWLLGAVDSDVWWPCGFKIEARQG
jgi:hypothetical protein